MAGGDQFLIDNRTDIHAFRQRYVVDILNLGNGLEYSGTFGGQAGQDVRARIIRQCDKCLCVFDPLLHQQVSITSVPIDDQDISGNDLGYAVALVFVCLDYFYTDIVREILAGTDRDTATAHNDDFLYFGISLARMQPDIFDMAFGRCKENDISRFYTVRTTGDNGLVLPFDGNDMIEFLFVQQFGQIFVHKPGIIAHFYTDQDQGASEQLPVLTGPRSFDSRDNFFSCQHFRVDHGIDPHLFEQFLVFRKQVFVIVDTCQRLTCP